MQKSVNVMVPTVSEEAVFNQLSEEIMKTNAITDDQIELLTKAFGERFTNAYKIVEKGWVKKYLFHSSGRIIWIVTGKEGDYQILPHISFCSCDDFYFRVVSNEVFRCYHLIAQKLAEVLDRYILVEFQDTEYDSFMTGLRRIKTERRLLSIEETENVRRFVGAVLSETGEMSTEKLLEEAKKNGFRLTVHHLANILTADKRKRFKCKDRLWTLTKG